MYAKKIQKLFVNKYFKIDVIKQIKEYNLLETPCNSNILALWDGCGIVMISLNSIL